MFDVGPCASWSGAWGGLLLLQKRRLITGQKEQNQSIEGRSETCLHWANASRGWSSRHMLGTYGPYRGAQGLAEEGPSLKKALLA